MTKPLNIGVAGLGTVGLGVVEMLEKNGDIIQTRAGRSVRLSHVSARDKNKNRGTDLSSYKWVDNAPDMADAEDCDVVVELIGGSEGDAYDLVKRALENGKHVVTANKALLAHHGTELAQIAHDKNVSLNYEAAVAGGIPAIKALREGLAANRISAVYGILNGTSNYILTAMRENGQDFKEVLKEAQDKGYAEADPTFDIDGTDAAHKLTILSALAFGIKPEFGKVHKVGIENVNDQDIKFADEIGCRIKLLAIAKFNEDGELIKTVEPCLLSNKNPLSAVEGVYNGVMYEGDYIETPILTGLGAGRNATASSVVADIIDIARGLHLPTFGVSPAHLQTASPRDRDEQTGEYYIRLTVEDKSGVFCQIASVLRDHGISMKSLFQHGLASEETGDGISVPITMQTHQTKYGLIRKAVAAIEKLDCTTSKPCFMPIYKNL